MRSRRPSPLRFIPPLAICVAVAAFAASRRPPAPAPAEPVREAVAPPPAPAQRQAEKAEVAAVLPPSPAPAPEQVQKTEPAQPPWTIERLRWLWTAQMYQSDTRVNHRWLSAHGFSVEDAGDIQREHDSIRVLADTAMDLLRAQRPRRAGEVADEALARYNAVAKAVGLPLRTAGSPAPEEPPESAAIRKGMERQDAERKARERAEFIREASRPPGDGH